MKLSDLARPPIQPHEIEGAPTAICVLHDGLIASTHNADEVGKVFYCPIGRQMWRFTKERTGMFASLPYHHERPI